MYLGDDELHALLSKYASVFDVRIMRDAATGRSKRFGFATVSSRRDGEQIIAQLHRKPIVKATDGSYRVTASNSDTAFRMGLEWKKKKK